MKVPDYPELSIRQTVQLVHEYMSDKAIFQWMTKNIFRPKNHVSGSSTRGAGSTLDYFDQITVGGIHSLLSSGMRFDQFPDILLQKPVDKSLIDIEPVPDKEGNLYLSHGSKEKQFRDLADYDLLGDPRKRGIQAYLEANDCRVCALIRISRPRAVGDTLKRRGVSKIFLFPIEDYTYYTADIPVVDPFERHTFMYFGYWRNFVEEKLMQLR